LGGPLEHEFYVVQTKGEGEGEKREEEGRVAGFGESNELDVLRG